MMHFRRYIFAVMLAFFISPKPAHAWVFHDGPAFGQRIMQYIQYLQQWNTLLRNGSQQLNAVRAAYAGMRDWRNFGWMDTLRLADSPWFDGIQGIDEIRNYCSLTIISAQQAQDLFNNVAALRALINDRRYQTDPWYRWRANAMIRQSEKARTTKQALLRQMQMQNKDLMDDVAKLKHLHEKIRLANMSTPADSATITSCNAEITALQTKMQGNSIAVKNQQAIMFLVGEKDMMKAYQNQMDRTNQVSSATIAKSVASGLGR